MLRPATVWPAPLNRSQVWNQITTRSDHRKLQIWPRDTWKSISLITRPETASGAIKRRVAAATAGRWALHTVALLQFKANIVIQCYTWIDYRVGLAVSLIYIVYIIMFQFHYVIDSTITVLCCGKGTPSTLADYEQGNIARVTAVGVHTHYIHIFILKVYVFTTPYYWKGGETKNNHGPVFMGSK